MIVNHEAGLRGRAPRRVVTVLAPLLGVALVLLPITPSAMSPGVGTAAAADGPPDTLQVVNKTVSPLSAVPNGTLVYSISYSCPGIVAGGTCSGATIKDPLPQYVDIDGGTRQLTFVSAAGNSQFGAGTVSGASPNQVVTWTAGAGLTAGASGVLNLTVRVPRGLTPAGAQTVTNVATATLAGVTDDSPVASATISASGTDYTLTKTGPATLLIGSSASSNGTYSLKVCPTPNTAALSPSVTIIDTLPTGATFVSATAGGAYTDNPDPTQDVVAWTITAANRPTIDANGCFTVQTVMRFQSPGSGGDASNVPTAVKTNSATATVGATIRSSAVNTTLNGPITRVTRAKTVTVGGTYVTDGDRVTYSLQFSNSSDVGADPLSTGVLIDGPLPAEFTLDAITTGTWPWGHTATVEVSADNSTWSTVASGLTGAASTTISAGLSTAKYVRWSFTGPIAVGQATAAITLSGLVSGAVVPSSTLTNCATATATQGAANFSSGNLCRTVTLEVPQPHPSILKSVSGGSTATVNPGSSVTYTVRVGDDADATSSLVDPTVVDCVPGGFAVTSIVPGAGWTRDLAYTNVPCSTAGGTPLRFTYSGSVAAGGFAPVITYTVQANGFNDPDGLIVSPGNYPNTATLRTSADTTFGHCATASCQSTATVTVPVVAQLTSQKQAQGALDASFSSAANTMPGAGVTWRLTLQNTGNVDAVDPVFIDIFPHIGDTGVLVYNVPRNSQWGTYLVSPIATTAGWTASYSLSANPCRPEVGGPVSACDVPNWTTTPSLTDISRYQSVKLAYTGIVPRGTAAQFEWQSRAPVLAAAFDAIDTTASPYDTIIACTATPSTCPKAVNSFAYGTHVDPTDLNGMPDPGLLSSEPPVVSVAVSEIPRPNVVGNRVWDDVNHNGVQDSGEAGIPNVRVEFFVDVAGSWVPYQPYGFTYTDADGHYLFPDVPDGFYKLRFSLPDGSSYVTLQDVTGVPGDDPASLNSDDDSDVPAAPSGANVYGNYYDTPTIDLGNMAGDEIDNSWDAGVWFPRPGITVAKRLNGQDTNVAPGLELFPGDPIAWTYTVTNSGNTYLSGVTVADHVTAGGVTDPVPVCNWASSSDPQTPAGFLSRGEVVSCSASDNAISGAYANTVTVNATGTMDPTDPTNGATYATISRLTPVARAVSDTDTGHYAGLTYALGDLVYLDVDTSGGYNPPTDVPIVNGTPVQLFDQDDQLVASTTTTAGRYLFTGLRPGSYYVVIPGTQFAIGSPLVNLTAAPAAVLDPNGDLDEGVDHHAISDGAGGVRSSGLITLSSSVSAGAFVGNEPTGDDPGLIAGALNDRRTNQTLDLALAGPYPLVVQTDAVCVADVPMLSYRIDPRYFSPTTVGTITIHPYLAGPDGVFGNADDVPSATPVQTVNNVPLGQWVQQLWPGSSLSPRDWPGWVLTNGVWVVDHDGLTPKVLVRASVNPVATTVALYPAATPACNPNPPVASVGDRVWWDKNGDGVQDTGEPGIGGARVTVTWAGPDGAFGNGDDVVHPAVVTDANGNWTLASLPSGNYRAAVALFDSGELVPSFDLDGLGSSGVTFSLADDQDRTDVDFGFVARFTLGDLVFGDVDGDGRYTAGRDTTVAGVTVQLTDAAGGVLATTTTNASGRYQFPGLLPGDYRVAIPSAELSTGGTIAGWSVGLLPVANPNTNVDEGADHNGLAFGGGVRSGVVTLSATLAPSGAFSGDEPSGMTNSTLDLAVRGPAAIAITKTVGWPTAEGETQHVPFLGGVQWRITVTNTGRQDLANVIVTDALASNCDTVHGALQVGASFVVLCRSDDLTAGFTNSATVDSTEPGGGPVTATDTASVTVDPPVPGIVLVKYVTDELAAPTAGALHDANTTPGFTAAPGTPVRWVYRLSNTGNTPLDITSFVDTNTSPLGVDDFPVLPSMYVSGDTDLDGLLDVDEIWYYATTADTIMSAGQTITSATVVAAPTDAFGGHLVDATPKTDTDDADHFGVTTGLTITKTTNGFDGATVPGPFVRVGQPVTWQYVVSNDGNLALVDVAVVDAPMEAIACPGGNPIPSLAPGASTTCTATVDTSATLGQYRNDVTAFGTPVDDLGVPVTGPGIVVPTATDASHYFGWDASITVVKAVDAVDPLLPSVAEDANTAPGPLRPQGATVTWTYRVTNNGFMPLTAVDVTDSQAGVDITCPGPHDPVDAAHTIDLLLPGATVVCTATDTVGLGQSSTTATATGQPAEPVGSDFEGVAPDAIVWPVDPAVYRAIAVAGTPVDRVTDSDDAHHFGWTAAIDVVKRVNGRLAPDAPGLFVPAGAPVVWTYTVTNTSFAPLLDVAVTDDMQGAADCGAADGNADGRIDLLLPGTANAVVCSISGSAIDALPDPNYANAVAVSGQPVYPAGDPSFDPSGVDPVAPVWPTDPAVYAPLPAPGNELGGTPADPVTGTDVAHLFAAAPAVQIVKTTNGLDADTATGPTVMVGDDVVWEYLVTNTGNTPLAGLIVTDDRLPASAIDCGAGANTLAGLAVGATVTCTAVGVAALGQYANTGTVVATAVDDKGTAIVDPVTDQSLPQLVATNPSHYFGAAPAVQIAKEVCAAASTAACTVHAAHNWAEHADVKSDGKAVWRITVRNNGNVRLTDVVVADVLEPACNRTIGVMAPGAVVQWVCTTTAVTEPMHNVATVTAIPVGGSGVQLTSGPAHRPVVLTAHDDASVSPPANLRLEKTVGTQVASADTQVAWTLTVVNDGPGVARNTTVEDTFPQGLTPVTLPEGTSFDAATGVLHWDLGTLQPGDTMSITYITSIDLGVTGALTNVALVQSESAVLEPNLDDNDAGATVMVASNGPVDLPQTGTNALLILLLGLGALVSGLGATAVVKRR